MRYLSLMSMLVLSSVLFAQKEVKVAVFSKVNYDLPVKLMLIKGAEPKAELSGDYEKILFEVKDKTLELNLNGAIPDANKVIKLYFSELTELITNGAGSVEMPVGEKITADSFSLKCNGVVKVNLAFAVKVLALDMEGASKVTLNGKVETANLKLSGVGKLFANELRCKDMMVNASGASFYNIHTSGDLLIDASGASKGIYAGNPVNKIININGLANIVDAATGDQMKDERSGDDTTRITIGKKKFIIIEDKDKITLGEDGKKVVKQYKLKRVYAGFELGINQFTTATMQTNLPTQYDFLEVKPEKSWFYGLNLWEGDYQIVKNKLALSTGFGMEFQEFNFNSNQVLQANQNVLSADSGFIVLSKNRLYAYQLNVPLMVKFAPRTKKSKNKFHLALGVIGSFKAYSHLNTETSAQGFEEHSKIVDDFNINPFRLTATARAGYGWFRAFANYSLTPYFKTSDGNPDFRTLSVGLTLIPF
jgi:hypothetical protein